MKKTIRQYYNGNVKVTIDLATGTKVRQTPDDEFQPVFAECCDIHISDRCDNGCEFCYAGCTADGKVGDILSWSFLDTLHPWTEIAINLQDPMPNDIWIFLKKMKDKQVIVNVTVNQRHFMRKHFRKCLLDMKEKGLIFGIGISLVEPTDEFIEIVKSVDDIVIHVINGIVTTEQLAKLAHKGLKVLILGYKNIGRGIKYVQDLENKKLVRNRKGFLYWNIKFILRENWFDVIAFDNLALEQLNLKRFLSDEEWQSFYQGDDGTSTFFINLVDGTFGKNSLCTRQERYPIGNKSIDEMFKEVKKWKSIS